MINKQSATWVQLVEILQAERGACYKAIGVPGCPEREADMLRGEIRRLDKVIALPETVPTQPKEVETDLSYL